MVFKFYVHNRALTRGTASERRADEPAGAIRRTSPLAWLSLTTFLIGGFRFAYPPYDYWNYFFNM